MVPVVPTFLFGRVRLCMGTVRSTVVALGLLALWACDTTSSEPRFDYVTQDTRDERGCFAVGPEVVRHACGHVRGTPDEITAAPLGGQRPGPELGAVHQPVTVHLLGEAGIARGQVAFTADVTGDWVFLTSIPVDFAVVVDGDDLLPAAAVGVEGQCEDLVMGTVFSLRAGQEVILQMRSVEGASPTLVAEYLSAFTRCRLPDILDFDQKPSGADTRGGEFAETLFRDSGVTFFCDTAMPRGPDACILFETSHPTGGDRDLGTPNRSFGGPGRGEGGESGRVGENWQAQHRVLIIAEDVKDCQPDGLVDDPDDSGKGGTIYAYFDEPVDLSFATLLDISSETPLRCLDASGEEHVVVAPALGENSFQQVALPCEDTVQFSMTLSRSGALAGLGFSSALRPRR